MKLNKNLGMILLSLWLITHAVVSLINANIPAVNITRAVLALLAGVVILLFDKSTA